jgi:hypothetical protein
LLIVVHEKPEAERNLAVSSAEYLLESNALTGPQATNRYSRLVAERAMR